MPIITTFSISFVGLPDGKYDGSMSGDVVQVKIKKSLIDRELVVHSSHAIYVEFQVNDSVRGINIPVEVEVISNGAVVTR